jgi:hypothetical protein
MIESLEEYEAKAARVDEAIFEWWISQEFPSVAVIWEGTDLQRKNAAVQLSKVRRKLEASEFVLVGSLHY